MPASLAIDLGRLPLVWPCSAAGLLVCTIGDALSRSTTTSSQTLFWVGILAIYAPVVWRLTGGAARRTERLALVVLLGLVLYLVKVEYSPFGFTFADELAHAPNANAILRTHQLFASNPILPVTAYYPGLESVTAAFAALSGLSVFGAGLVIIAAARIVLVIALFLLFERVSGSARIAGLGTALYAANANFVFFSAQFSYESLALPLALVALLGVAEWSRSPQRRGWEALILLVMAAVVVTHHMSAYALLATLLALCVSTGLRGVGGWRSAPWPFLAFGIAAVVLWLVFVASYTIGYLTPVFWTALHSTFQVVSGEAAPRHLFGGSSGGYQAPLLERAVALAAVAALAIALPFGLRAVRRRYPRQPFALVFAAAAACYVVVLGLRFAPGAWETANRSSEFLFVGSAFLLPLARLDRWRPARWPPFGRAAAAACASLLFAGGVIAGWTPTLRQAQPYRIEAGGHAIEPVGRELAGWAAHSLGRGLRFATTASEARLLATFAGEDARFGRTPDVDDILQTPTLPAWQRFDLRHYRFRYVAVDRRKRSFDNLAGYFFGRRRPRAARDVLLPTAVASKFADAGASRIYDAGPVQVYDLSSAWFWHR